MKNCLMYLYLIQEISKGHIKEVNAVLNSKSFKDDKQQIIAHLKDSIYEQEADIANKKRLLNLMGSSY